MRKIVVHLWRRNSPIYVGELSMEAGDSIERTEAILAHLCDVGAVRYLGDDEKRALGLDARGVLIVLIDHGLVEHLEP